MTFLLTAAFAPRVLLLEPASSSASLLVVARHRPALRGVLGRGDASSSRAALAPALRGARGRRRRRSTRPTSSRSTRVPARLAIANVGVRARRSSLATLIPQLRPQAIDTYTELALVAPRAHDGEHGGAAGVRHDARAGGARPRARVRRTSRTRRCAASVAASLGRVRKRFVAAVAAPVAFVALGASLLVDAHARAVRPRRARRPTRPTSRAPRSSRSTERPTTCAGAPRPSRPPRRSASASTSIPAYDGERTVRHGDEGRDAGRRCRSPSRARARSLRYDAALPGVRRLRAPRARRGRARGDPRHAHRRAFFDADVALATREMRRAGVAEVMRGTIILHEARFSTVARAARRRRFARRRSSASSPSAQQRSIDAREATERMRGLLLASMSHDLKAPLNAVLGFAELVRRNPLTRRKTRASRSSSSVGASS